MRSDCLEFLAVGGVPDHNGAIFAGGGQSRSIGGKVKRSYPAFVFLKIAFECASREVPELHKAVVSRRSGQRAVLRNLDGPHGCWVANQIPHPRPVGLPDDHIAWPVEEALAAGRDKRGSIARIIGRDHPPRQFGKSGRRGRWSCGSRCRCGSRCGIATGNP